MSAHTITSLAALEALYDQPKGGSLAKEIDYISPEYARLIAASPFVALATSGPGGLDCTPRGDAPGFVAIEDDKTLLMPDRRGNNRLDTLRNIIADPRVALLFLIPGHTETMRVNGRAVISTDPALLARFAIGGHEPKTVLMITVERAYFQCARAILRSQLWDATRHVDKRTLPTAGEILAATKPGEFEARAYDADLADRLPKQLY
jgi:hypothetical protein